MFAKELASALSKVKSESTLWTRCALAAGFEDSMRKCIVIATQENQRTYKACSRFNEPSPHKGDLAAADAVRAPAPRIPLGGGRSSLWQKKRWEQHD